jgi:hypothetical protein
MKKWRPARISTVIAFLCMFPTGCAPGYDRPLVNSC